MEETCTRQFAENTIWSDWIRKEGGKKEEGRRKGKEEKKRFFMGIEVESHKDAQS